MPSTRMDIGLQSIYFHLIKSDADILNSRTVYYRQIHLLLQLGFQED